MTFSMSWVLPVNSRLVRAIGEALQEAKLAQEKTGQAARRFRDFRYRTRKSWSCERRVVGKAEYLAKGSNPRFVVTNLSRRRVAAKRLYENLYCARGEMENRIKEQQLGLFADRTSTADDASEPAPTVFFLVGLRADVWTAPTRA